MTKNKILLWTAALILLAAFAKEKLDCNDFKEDKSLCGAENRH